MVSDWKNKANTTKEADVSSGLRTMHGKTFQKVTNHPGRESGAMSHHIEGAKGNINVKSTVVDTHLRKRAAIRIE